MLHGASWRALPPLSISILLTPPSPTLSTGSIYGDTFDAEGWDNLDAVHTMTEEDMIEIGVKR